MNEETVESTTPARGDPAVGRNSELRVVARGGFALGAATALATVMSVPTVALLVRSMGVSAYGTLVFALGLVQLMATFADLGLANGVARMSAFAGRADDARWAKAGLTLVSISGAVATILCVGIALNLTPSAREVLLAASALPLVVTVRSVLEAYSRVRKRIALVEGSYALGQVLYCGAAMTLAIAGAASASGIALLRVLVSAAAALLLVPSWLRSTAGSVKGRGTWKILLRFSFPLLIASVAWSALQSSDVIMLGLIRGTHAVGLYAPVLQMVDVITTLMFILGTYYLPSASRLVAKGDFTALRSIYTTVTKWGLVIAMPLLAVLIVAPSPLLLALFGSQYGGRTPSLIARILCIGYVMTVVTGQNGFSLIALGASRAIGIRSAIALGANLAVNAILIPALGAVGAAIGTTVVYTGLNATNSYLIWRIARVHPIRRDTVTVFGASVVSTLFSLVLVVGLHWQDSLRACAVTALVVGGASLMAWFMTSSPEERGSLFPAVLGAGAYRGRKT